MLESDAWLESISCAKPLGAATSAVGVPPQNPYLVYLLMVDYAAQNAILTGGEAGLSMLSNVLSAHTCFLLEMLDKRYAALKARKAQYGASVAVEDAGDPTKMTPLNRVVDLSVGLGSFHCLSQQQPAIGFNSSGILQK